MSASNKSAGDHPAAGVHAPFKSPLRTVNQQQLQPQEPSKLTSPAHSKLITKRDDKTVPGCEAQRKDKKTELEELKRKFMENRPVPLDVDEELAKWRERMHAYNEAKDACLILFGRLAHIKGCLVRDLYETYGLDLDD
ncbi:unnamed protein product [Calicophoron daubneyi]|uniref:DNA repair protein SWI5 homolog n=1 Tax=Calicophoron daubneyi TaxID=300641 RepID=A0AAV2TIM1_CALDB